jgi:ABC-type phosphate transport system permease subunit
MLKWYVGGIVSICIGSSMAVANLAKYGETNLLFAIGVILFLFGLIVLIVFWGEVNDLIRDRDKKNKRSK